MHDVWILYRVGMGRLPSNLVPYFWSVTVRENTQCPRRRPPWAYYYTVTNQRTQHVYLKNAQWSKEPDPIITTLDLELIIPQSSLIVAKAAEGPCYRKPPMKSGSSRNAKRVKFRTRFDHNYFPFISILDSKRQESKACTYPRLQSTAIPCLKILCSAILFR